jgi:hypothetical protein
LKAIRVTGDRADLIDVSDAAERNGWSVPDRGLPPEADYLFFYRGDFYQPEIMYSVFYDSTSKDTYFANVRPKHRKEVTINDADDIAEVIDFLKGGPES